MKNVMALIEEGRIEVMDLEAFDRVLEDYVVSFMQPLYQDGHGDATAVAFLGRAPVMVTASYRDAVLPAYLAHFCMTRELAREKTKKLLHLEKGGHLPFYIQATEDVMVETKCRTEKVGRDTAYGCYNATMYERCGGVVSAKGLEYCGFFFPRKQDSHPERFSRLMRLSRRLFEEAMAHFCYKKK
ncbi:hypothetical protein [Eubacterium sp. 1001713B170207_170306_E7]|uniref:hypothetical protein n=1 Tax=Eubacterium sp. 1001713B170207_170306_E7 TaxID=2787097 RepID=UPI001898AFF0|nr:hypothetical protein [Eubacterium sp. 1001713B170207_170306_E7]